MTAWRWRTLGSVALFWTGYGAILVLFGMLKGMLPPAARDLIWGSLSSLALLGLTAWLVRHERGRLRAVGAALEGRSLLRLGQGIAVGLALYALIFLGVSVVAGPLTLGSATPSATMQSGLLVLATYLAMSAMEELGFRGYPLRTLGPAIGEWPAQLLTAVAFGSTHLLYGWHWSTVLLGVVPSGLLFGAAAAASQGLAFPIGLHAALNLAAWSIGSKDLPGLWSVGLPEGAQERVGTVAPWISLALTLATAAVLYRLRDHRVTKILSGASPAA